VLVTYHLHAPDKCLRMSDDRWYEEEFDDYHSTTARGNIVDGKEELFGLDQLKTPGGGSSSA